MKKSEARVLYMISVLPKHLRYSEHLSMKLDLDYVYLTRIVKKMIYKEWLNIHSYGHKKFLIITENAPIKEANKMMSEIRLQELEFENSTPIKQPKK